MNVTIDAPAGYEYQYLASVYLILSFTQKGLLKNAVVDSLSKEDLHLTVMTSHGKNETIEVQFKKKKGTLNIDQFAAYWTHFNAYSDQVNVLPKLADRTADRYYLICNYKAKDYADDLGILANSTTFLNMKIANLKRQI